jgi:hypothetical protein
VIIREIILIAKIARMRDRSTGPVLNRLSNFLHGATIGSVREIIKAFILYRAGGELGDAKGPTNQLKIALAKSKKDSTFDIVCITCMIKPCPI